MSDREMDLRGMNTPELIRACRGMCRTPKCRRAATSDGLCHACALQIEALERTYRRGPVRGAVKAAAVWAQGLIKRSEWAFVLFFLACCMAEIAWSLLPYFVEFLRMAKHALVGGQ